MSTKWVGPVCLLALVFLRPDSCISSTIPASPNGIPIYVDDESFAKHGITLNAARNDLYDLAGVVPTVRLCISFTNTSSQIVKAVRFYAVMKNSFNEDIGDFNLDRSGSFAPNVLIEGPVYSQLRNSRDMSDRLYNCWSVNTQQHADHMILGVDKIALPESDR